MKGEPSSMTFGSAICHEYSFCGNDLNLFIHFHLVITYLLQNQMNTTTVFFRMFQIETTINI